MYMTHRTVGSVVPVAVRHVSPKMDTGGEYGATGCGPKYRHARMQPPTLSPEDSDAAASAAHAPYIRLCAAEAAEA